MLRGSYDLRRSEVLDSLLYSETNIKVFYENLMEDQKKDFLQRADLYSRKVVV